MSKTELTDNLTFAAAVQMLAQLAAQGFLSAEEQARTRQELERKLRPTLILPGFWGCKLPSFGSRFSLLIVNSFTPDVVVLSLLKGGSRPW